MTNVYVVVDNVNYRGDYILSVHSTRESAEDRRAAYVQWDDYVGTLVIRVYEIA